MPTGGLAGTYRISDRLWSKIQPLLPVHVNRHRWGGGRPRVSDRRCLDAIFYVLRTGCQWGALDATNLCRRSTAHDRFQAWAKAGVFERLWEAGLTEYDELKGLDWSWLSMDGVMTKAPLGGGKNREKSHRSWQGGRQAVGADRGRRHPRGPDGRRGQPA